MTEAIPVLRVQATAPEMVRRLGLIVGGLAAVIARRFLRDPKFGALVAPLWGWLNRTVQRVGRAPVGAPVRVRAPVAPRVAPDDAAGRAVRPRLRLPTGRGWLVQALGWEAAGYGSQLQALLAEPEMQALLDAVPAVGRALRPLGRMLGVQVGPARVKPPAAAKPRAVRVRRPRAELVRAGDPRRWSPGPIPSSWWPEKKRR